MNARPVHAAQVSLSSFFGTWRPSTGSRSSAARRGKSGRARRGGRPDRPVRVARRPRTVVERAPADRRPGCRFQLSALVEVEFGSTFDAGVLAAVGERAVVGQALPRILTRGPADGGLGRHPRCLRRRQQQGRRGDGHLAANLAVDGRQLCFPRRDRRRALEPDPALQLDLGTRRRGQHRVPRAIANRRRAAGCSFSQLRYLPEALDDLRGGD